MFCENIKKVDLMKRTIISNKTNVSFVNVGLISLKNGMIDLKEEIYIYCVLACRKLIYLCRLFITLRYKQQISRTYLND